MRVPNNMSVILMPCPVPARLIIFCDKMLTMPNAAKILLAACLGVFAFALTQQYGFGIRPCILCIWQRIPYAGTGALTLLALLWRPYGKQSALLLFICAACYLIGMGLAFFHTGVELHWWLGTSGCAIHPLNGTSAQDLRASLLALAPVRCDAISWSLFGLSMANYNVAMSLALAVFAAVAGAKKWHEAIFRK
jgi:disulfide bond formation protein DsbB